MYGRLQRFAHEVHYARTGSYASLLKGIGIIPEGINNNPVVYDFMASLAWQQDSVDVQQWIKKYVRYGYENDTLQQAWQLLFQTVYSSPPVRQEGPSESIFCARPGIDLQRVSSWGTRKRNYDTALFEKAVRLFVQAGHNSPSSGTTYEVDRIDLVRQLLANRADGNYQKMMDAIKEKDKEAFLQSYNRFETMLLQQDSLLAGNDFFSLNRWLLQASRFAKSKTDKELAIRNAKMQISYWGPDNPQTDLHDYAQKEWGGLLSSLYLKRWQRFRDDQVALMEGGEATADYFSIEKTWAEDPSMPLPKKMDAKQKAALLERIIGL